MSIERQYEGGSPLLAHMGQQEAGELCVQLRQELIRDVARTGGHLASNLGAVELTVAIHRVFDTSRDRLVFDVGHQSYTHKMLTGRREQMSGIRQFGGIAGFPKPSESVHDAFIAGHASNSVAVAVGMARARDMAQEDYRVLVLMGDGALTGGLAYEGLSTGGQLKSQLLVILNDNGMSITKNVGGVAEHLARQRLKSQYRTFKKYYRKIMNATWLGRKVYRVTHRLKKGIKQSLLPSSLFENMGFNYLGPVDGHNLAELTEIMRYARDLNEPVLLHVRTVKGKDFTPAEESPDAFHGVSPFDPETGEPLKAGRASFSTAFGKSLARLAQQDGRVCAITAAMETGTGLDYFALRYPQRFFDVGIAEGCAVSMAAGLAKQGAAPVVAVYSTFLQRAYDMLLHDVALDHLHVVLAVDRAGLVGEDGETHHGVFDVSYLNSVPGMRVYAPANFAELDRMLEHAVLRCDGPVAIRYPRGGEGAYRADSGGEDAVCLQPGADLTMAAYGTQINDVLQAADILQQKGIQAEVIKINTLTPLNRQLVLESVRRTGSLLVVEDSVAADSVGQRLACALQEAEIAARVSLCNSGSAFTTHGSVDQLKRLLRLDGASVAERAMEVLKRGKTATGC